MSYEKQTWVNRDLTKPLNDGRMNHIEEGIFEAAAVADAAQVAANLDADTATLVGDVETATGAALSATIGEGAAAAVNTVGGVTDFLQLPGELYGTIGVNAGSFAQDNIATAPNGDMHVVYWDSRKRPMIARRSSLYRSWATFDLSTVLGNPLASPVEEDGHNILSLGIDGDGRIHVAGNMHNDTLRYVRSVNANDITSWTAPGMVGTEETSVSYPAFLRLSGGDLLFFYRNGESGNGDTYLNRYAIGSDTWSRVAQIFKGTSPVSPDESAYLNHVVRETDDTLHLFYLWRTTGSETTNHDVSYITSSDDGVTWTAANGTGMPLPIEPTDTASLVASGLGTTLVNQTGASVDINGVPHAAWWLTPTPGTAELHHFYYSGGAWHDDVAITLPVAATRPGVFSYQDKTWAIYSNGGMVTSLRLAPTVGEQAVLYPLPVNQWECTYDTLSSRFRTLLTPSASNLPSTWGGVLSLDPSQLDGIDADRILPVPRALPATIDIPPVGASPMLVGYWYNAAGQRDTTTVTIARTSYRAGIIIPARDCTISQAAIRLTSGGASSTYKVAVYDVATTKLIAQSAAQNGTTTGIITMDIPFKLRAGQAVYVGIVTQTADTVPQFGRLATSGDHRLGALTATQAVDNANNYVGINATLGDGALPATLTVNLTTSVPLVALLVAA
jgi:hypothetical protein